jgi:hypothetical protein
LSYNHTTKQIDMKQNNSHGPVIHSFDNATPLSVVASTFAAL